MGEGLLLGIDLGTMSSKGVLCGPDGEVVATTERPHDVSMPRPGWVEHDAEEVWWKDFAAMCSELLEGAEEPVAAVCVSGIGPCFLAAGKDGAVGRLHRHDVQIGLAWLQDLADAGDRAAGPDAGHEDVDVAAGVVPDFLGGGASVDVRICWIFELLRDHGEQPVVIGEIRRGDAGVVIHG